MRTRIACCLAASLVLSATAASGREPRFTLDRKTVAVGERPRVTFDAPLPAVSNERFWITIIEKSERDPAWGEWQYVAAGSTEVVLKKTKKAGDFEVRLHDGYPRVQYNVVYRRSLRVTSGKSGSRNPSGSHSKNAPSRSATNRPHTLSDMSVFWEGRSGDADTTFDPPHWIHPDIVSVHAVGRNGELILTVTFDTDLEETLHQKTKSGAMKGYLLAEVYFDIDNNVGTGKKIGMAPERRGYDLDLEIDTGLKLKSRGVTMSQWGNIESIPEAHEVTDVLLKYSVESRSTLGSQIKSSYRSSVPAEKRMKMQGKELIIRVPYEQLGLKPGASVRMCFQDHTMKMFEGDVVSADARLTVQ